VIDITCYSGTVLLELVRSSLPRLLLEKTTFTVEDYCGGGCLCRSGRRSLRDRRKRGLKSRCRWTQTTCQSVLRPLRWQTESKFWRVLSRMSFISWKMQYGWESNAHKKHLLETNQKTILKRNTIHYRFWTMFACPMNSYICTNLSSIHLHHREPPSPLLLASFEFLLAAPISLAIRLSALSETRLVRFIFLVKFW